MPRYRICYKVLGGTAYTTEDAPTMTEAVDRALNRWPFPTVFLWAAWRWEDQQ